MLIDRTHRGWIVGCLIALAVAAAVYIPYYRASLHHPSGGSAIGLTYGIAGFALMIFAGLLGARRKVPMWRLGRAATWMRGHIWLGLLSFPLILFHGGFHFGGAVTFALMWLFVVVVVSGVVGLLLQQVLPRLMLTRVPLETVYEQIDPVVEQLRGEADELVAAAAGSLPVSSARSVEVRRAGGGADERMGQPRSSPRAAPVALAPTPESNVLRDAYLRDIRPFLDPRNRRDGVIDTAAKSATLFRELRTALPPVLHQTVAELESICDERRQLADQKRLHHWLHGWLLVHVPLSLALLLLGAVHAVIALRY